MDVLQIGRFFVTGFKVKHHAVDQPIHVTPTSLHQIPSGEYLFKRPRVQQYFILAEYDYILGKCSVHIHFLRHHTMHHINTKCLQL